jgi:hypothetical protein
MLTRLLNMFRSELNQKLERIEQGMEQVVKVSTSENAWVAYYRSPDIDPSRLVFWVCVQSDAEKERLANDAPLGRQLREQLTKHDYPIEARAKVHIGFESQETVDRTSKGNWFAHWGSESPAASAVADLVHHGAWDRLPSPSRRQGEGGRRSPG